MTHCYIFDYVNAKIYHTTIPDDVEDIDSYIAEKLNINKSSTQKNSGNK